jgi:hypothetical protein
MKWCILLRVHTSSSKEIVCLQVKVQNSAINSSENILKLWISPEGLLIPIKSWKCCTDICVRSKEQLEHVVVLTCELQRPTY